MDCDILKVYDESVIVREVQSVWKRTGSAKPTSGLVSGSTRHGKSTLLGWEPMAEHPVPQAAQYPGEYSGTDVSIEHLHLRRDFPHLCFFRADPPSDLWTHG